MKIQILDLIEGAKAARGLTVIIDVFRAFSLECLLTAKGAAAIHPVGKVEEAFALKEQHPDWILFGERHGALVEGFAYGNSPTQCMDADVAGRTIVHTTGAGTQGIVNASGADEIITGSLVNAAAIVGYIRRQDPEAVSLVCMGRAGKAPSLEDTVCAEYLRALLEGEEYPIAEKIPLLREDGGKHFFDPERQHIYPQADFDFCTQLSIYPFVLKAEKQDGLYTSRKINILS